MNIAGYKFHQFIGPTPCSAPGVLIYVHQSSGKHFVRVMRNVRKHRGKNNYPTMLKELLKTDASEVLVYVADVANDTKEALHKAGNVVRNHLASKGALFKPPVTKQEEGAARFTVWKMTHKQSGAVYYCEEIKGACEAGKFAQRLNMFNNCVIRSVVSTNRIMYCFANKFFPLEIDHWDMEDLGLDFPLEIEARLRIATLSCKHLENNELVLNRIHNFDSLYYRNTFLKLPHIGIGEYLG